MKQKKNMKRLALALLGVGVVAVLVACGGGGSSSTSNDREFPSGLGAGSAISWTPGTLAFSINPGGRQIIPVTFTSSAALSNVAVTVVPELKNIVSVSPTTFATLQAGQQATITVTVAPSAAESLRLIEGAIRLVSGTSTVAKPLSVSLTLVAPQVINGVSVPPEPPADLNNATLAGFDTNGNGVRDDVERVVAQKASSVTGFDRALVFARAYQRFLVLPTVSQAESDGVMLIGECYAYANLSNPVGIGGSSIKAMTINTENRLANIRAKALILRSRPTDVVRDCN